MPYRAIIFDLFGTLVGNFSRRENDKVIAQLAEILFLSWREANDEDFGVISPTNVSNALRTTKIRNSGDAWEKPTLTDA